MHSGALGGEPNSSIRGPPTIEEGPGRVVLATVTHVNNEIYELRFVGQDEALRPTGTHRLYSEARVDWALTRDLVPGETLRTASGTVTLESIRCPPVDVARDEFVWTDVEFGSGDEKRPLLICGDVAGTAVRRAKPKGLDTFKEVRGL